MHKIIESVELHDTLNPKIWVGYELRDEVKEKLNEIVDKFILELHENDIPVKVLDARLVGSNASFNYTENSDLDVHIIANFEDTSCDVPVLSLLYNFFKKNFNDKYDISIHGVPVELYVEDMNASAVSNGVYSLFKDEWVKMPEPIEIPDIDITDEFNIYEDKYNKVINNNDAEASSDLVDELYLLRKDSISTDGEYGVGNLVFKEFRNKGYLDNLKQLLVDETSKELSLESLNETLSEYTKIPLSAKTINNYEKYFKLIKPWDNSMTGYIYLDGEKPVALLQVRKENPVFLNALEITPEYRGKRLSKELLDVATKELGVKKLGVESDNTKAINIYRKYGFKPTGEKTDWGFYMQLNEEQNAHDPKTASVAEWLNESKEDNQKLIDYVGEETADRFFKLKPRIKSPQNDLYYWLKKEPVELQDFLDDLESTKSKTQIEREAKQGAKLLYNKNGWKIYRIDTYEAATYYGKNTKWCISGNYPGSEGQGKTYFDDYKNNGVIDYYFIISPDNHKWCYLDVTPDFSDSVLWDEEDDGRTDIYDDTILDFPEDAVDVLPGLRSKIIDTGHVNKLRRKIIKTHKFVLNNETLKIFSMYNYSNMPVWFTDYVDEVVITNDIQSVPDNAFLYFDHIKNLVIEDGVKTIGSASFAMCDSLEKIAFPNSMMEIGDRAFLGCDNLLEVFIPKSVKKIGERAFYSCNKNLIIYCENSEEFVKNNYDENWNVISGIQFTDIKDRIKAKTIYNYRGKMESISYKKTSCLNEEYKTIEWIKQQFSDAFNKYSGGNKNLLKAKLNNITDGEWEDVIDFINSLKFPLIIYRGLKLNNIDELNTSDLGVNWTIDDELFFAPESAFYNSNYILATKITEDDIDYPETIQNYIYYSLRPQEGRWAESEITVKKDFKPSKYYILKKENDELVPVN